MPALALLGALATSVAVAAGLPSPSWGEARPSASCWSVPDRDREFVRCVGVVRDAGRLRCLWSATYVDGGLAALTCSTPRPPCKASRILYRRLGPPDGHLGPTLVWEEPSNTRIMASPGAVQWMDMAVFPTIGTVATWLAP